MNAPRKLRIVVLALQGIVLGSLLIVLIRTGGNSGSYRIVAYIFLATGAVPLILAAIPGRFSLRTLLIATTLIAVVLGLIVWAAH